MQPAPATVWAKIPTDMGGRFAAGNESTFTSEAGGLYRGESGGPIACESAWFGDSTLAPNKVISWFVTKFAFKRVNLYRYTSEEFTVHEHYLKIVSRSYDPLEGEPVQLYEYTFNSNRFKLMPPFAVGLYKFNPESS
jgi:hypothetical protein